MGIISRNRSFLLMTGLVVLVGAALFGGVVAVRVLAADATTPAAKASAPASYNQVSSYGMTGYAPLTIKPTAETPKFVTTRLEQNRGMVLLVYVDGAAADMEMLDYFTGLKQRYAADSSFLDFESREVTETGDILDQLRVSDPPMLAVIDGSGEVAQLYTGWISEAVMEQVIANAVRGL